MLTPQRLQDIERHCAIAPAPALAAWRAGIGAELPDLPADEREHAAALLLKLEHLERAEAAAPGQAPEYLAPELLLEAA